MNGTHEVLKHVLLGGVPGIFRETHLNNQVPTSRSTLVGKTGVDCEAGADAHCLHHCDIYIYII